ncbi:MAG: hypothetical protein ACJAW1_002563, partial [Glaciecola sp.]
MLVSYFRYFHILILNKSIKFQLIFSVQQLVLPNKNSRFWEVKACGHLRI